MDDVKYQAALCELQHRCPKTGSLWRHRKGGLYAVVRGAVIEGTLTPAVAYASVLAGPSSPLWIRPLEEFLDGRFVLESPGV